MDYCNQCRRHLNGALACAGCGTPVEELRYQSPIAPAAEHVLELDEVSEPAGHRHVRRQTSSRRKAAAGRRARKRRGRKVLLGTFGLVLAAGALSLAELAMENPGNDGAATAVKEDPNVETQPPPEPTDVDVTPKGPDRVTESPVSASSSARPTGTGTGTGGPGSGGTGKGKATATSRGGGRPSATPSAVQPSASTQPSSSGQPSESAPAGPPPSTAPAPTPAPSPTCSRFLFWCF
ncbi:SCO2400 family protein [Streptomyces sp. NPDC000880]